MDSEWRIVGLSPALAGANGALVLRLSRGLKTTLTNFRQNHFFLRRMAMICFVPKIQRVGYELFCLKFRFPGFLLGSYTNSKKV